MRMRSSPRGCSPLDRAVGYHEDHQLSRRGHRLKARIEERTDQLAATAYTSLTTGETGELARLLRPLTDAVVRAGDIPAARRASVRSSPR